MSENSPEHRNGIKAEYLTKIILILIFLAGIVVLILVTGSTRLIATIQSWSILDFVLLGLATTRLGRMVAYDRVMEPIRAPVARTVPDLSGAGDTVIAKGEGMQKSLGQLISCPICIGTWIAAGLVSGLVWLPGPARLFLWMIAAVALAEIFHAAIEAMTWSSVMNRTVTGVECLKRVSEEKADKS